MGAALSVASLGTKTAADVTTGYAKQYEYNTKAQDYLLEAQSKATNYLLSAKTSAANYRYTGQKEQAQYGIESGKYAMEASEYETAADYGKLRAELTDASAREELNTTIGNLVTQRAAGGADLSSPTTAALMAHATNISELNRKASVASIEADTAEKRAAADYLRQASEFALTQGSKAAQMGEYNAQNAEIYGKYNADTTLAYGKYNAEAATNLGDTAVTLGYLNASTDLLAGLGKATSPTGWLTGNV